MRKLILLAAVAIAAASCAQESNPVADAIAARLKEVTPEITNVTFETLELIDSTTLAKEIEYREKIFNLKVKLNSKHYQKYIAQGDEYKASERREALKDDQRILKGIGEIRENNKDALNKVVYYDYKFSALVEKGTATGTSKFQVKDYYACVTPDLKVLKYTSDQKDLHKGVGGVIPGYTELLGGAAEE